MLGLQGCDHPVDAQFVPEGLHDVHGAVGPGIDENNPWLSGNRFLAREDAQDTAGQAAQAFAIDFLGPAEVVDDLGDGAALLRIPDILGELVVLWDTNRKGFRLKLKIQIFPDYQFR